MHFCDLPNNIILYIAENLDPVSLGKFVQVNKAIHQLCTYDNILWKRVAKFHWETIPDILFLERLSLEKSSSSQDYEFAIVSRATSSNEKQVVTNGRNSSNPINLDSVLREQTNSTSEDSYWRRLLIDTYKHDSMKWKLNQVFGEDPASVNEENVITTVQFDHSGEFLAIGYQCGQIVVFRNTSADTYKFFTQFESHHPEFDFLTSLEIEEKINKIRWSKNTYPNNARLLLSTNDKTIKLWKLQEKRPKKSAIKHAGNNDSNGNDSSPVAEAIEKKVFSNAHAYNVNSVSLCSDGELFISADDLRINLWNLEISNEAFTFVDIKPTNMNELAEVITSVMFHPIECSQLVYSSSKGIAYLADMRIHALCDKTVRCFRERNSSNKSFFSEVTSSISDIQFSSSGRFILARDYLHLKIWDVNMEAEPVAVYNVHEHIRPKLYELYENDIIFDKFECCFSNNECHLLTGSYSNNFMVFDVVTSQVKYLQAVNPRDKRRRKNTNNLPVKEDINFDEKVTHLTWNPANDITAIAAGNYIYLYHLSKK